MHDQYAVKQVRGPYVTLSLHPNHCSTEQELIEYAEERRSQGAILGADLFSGAGGLSQGLVNAGIEVVLGIDHYQYALETHAARFPGMSVDWDLSTSDNVARVADLMKEAGIEVLAGGPPCQPFSKAGRSGIRHLVENGERDPDDQRRNLWRAYLEVVQLASPKAVIMENVPDIALDDEMFILRSMVTELEQIGYSVECKVIDTWRYGVPQFRQRFILVALRDNVKFEWPKEVSQKVSVWNAIGDLPEVEGGDRPDGGGDGFWDYSGPLTEYQTSMRANVRDEDKDRIYDHITRPVREDDRQAFEQMTAATRYSDLPEHLRRYRSDIFVDKYKRLDENDLSRTITAHIAKDGYSFIHPRQARTITVREAARLQSFPDDFRFSGPPSAAFKQIGNAVPVRLGEALGNGILNAWERNETKHYVSKDVVESLADWYRQQPDSGLLQPWLRTKSRWKIVVAEIFLLRSSWTETRFLWQLIDNLEEPEIGALPSDQTIATLRSVFAGERFKIRFSQFETLVEQMRENPKALWEPHIDRAKLPVLNDVLVRTLELSAPISDGTDSRSEEPVIVAKGVLRVTSRFLGVDTESRNKQSNGRISVGKLLGLDKNSREGHLALFEVARQLCVSEKPYCGVCPLSQMCDFAQRRGGDAEQPPEPETLF
ncbi:DNA cytosine methyltransferase [Corynebacterium lubricantis]|uniref:DNA cytosine methyltransferase n=1 Tax=Corynebacterium lubricantis TaxID=541095 RepID=UPI000525825E|nr:DNA cytosine methyltransferase [Corynebacterium lubricantis]